MKLVNILLAFLFGVAKPPKKMKKGSKVKIITPALVELNQAMMDAGTISEPVNEGWVHVIKDDVIVVRFRLPNTEGRERYETREYPIDQVVLIK